MNWAKEVGEDVFVWVQTLLKNKQHEEQAYRVCLGLLNLSRDYPSKRINNACALANQHQLYRLKHIKSILLSNQDQLPLIPSETQPEQPSLLSQTHENIRGPKSFH